jgi:hypothetical protein
MRERLAVFAQGIATRIGPPFVAVGRGFAAVWAFVALWSSRIWRGVWAAALWSFGVALRGIAPDHTAFGNSDRPALV